MDDAERGSALSEVRRVPADPARTWQAWSDPAELASWFWPPRFGTTCEADRSVGGRYRIASTTSELALSGVIVAVDPPRHLAVTWRWDGEDVETLLTVHLAKADLGGTDVVVRHEGFRNDEERDQHVIGWDGCLDRLVQRLS